MTDVAVVDLGYGDAGKGALVDRLCATGNVDVVVRFNGGCQAQHNVITSDGRHHTFSQFGSGTLKGVRTHLSLFMLVEPLSLMIEADALRRIGVLDPYALLTISPDALVTTPYHWIVNRHREDQRGDARHGSCGRGIGTTVEYSIAHPDEAVRVKDLYGSRTELHDKLIDLSLWCQTETAGSLPMMTRSELMAEYEKFTRRVTVMSDEDLVAHQRILFEGAQGVLLDEHVGFHPYTTWSTTTPDNARWLADLVGHDLRVIGVTRAYSTRHGAGPFVPEDNSLNCPEAHNRRERYQGAWRVGHLDAPALRDAVASSGGIDGVYVTHVDTAEAETRLMVCTSYRNVRLQRFPPESFDLRAEQSARLLRDEPVLSEREYFGWPQSVAHALSLPLYGMARGPCTSDGIFTAKGRREAGV